MKKSKLQFKMAMITVLVFLASSFAQSTFAQVHRYFSPTGSQNGDGSESNPYGPDYTYGWIDQSIYKMWAEPAVRSSGVIVHLASGSYLTRVGFILPWDVQPFPHFELRGAHKDTTTLTWVNDVSRGGGDWYCVSTYGGEQGVWANEFHISDLTIDCDALSHTIYSANNGQSVKLGGVYGKAHRGSLSSVRVTNFAAKGALMEVFPLRLDTKNLDEDYIVILDCVVDTFHAKEGGYCTAIMVAGFGFTTSGVGHEPSSNASIWVVDNTVYNIRGGIGLGFAAIHNVIFEGNSVYLASAGVNSDTGWARGIEIRNNAFVEVGVGISVGRGNESENDAWTDHTMISNYFHLVHPDPGQESYCIRLQGGHGVINITNNTVYFDPGFPPTIPTFGLRALPVYDPGTIVSQWGINQQIR